MHRPSKGLVAILGGLAASAVAVGYVLVLGHGSTQNKVQQVDPAIAETCTYEHQEEIDDSQQVHVFGDSTATVTAKLWAKGGCGTTPFEYKLWFSDTYVRRDDGRWQYAFGQASLPLPAK